MSEKFEYGERVRLIKNNKYPYYDLEGKIGTVRTTYYNAGQIAVEFDCVQNPKSSGGYFYFTRGYLEHVKDENDILEEKIMENKITNYLNIARVQFIGDECPSARFYANFESNLHVGDTCVCRWENGWKNVQFGVAKVVEILTDYNVETSDEIISKFDMDAYNARVENRKKAAELKAKMQERAKKLQDIALYQMLAEKDAEMANMLAEYQDLV